MWWLLGFYDFVWPMLAIKELAVAANADNVIFRFLMLGIVPGTNLQISFGDIVCLIWAVLFLVLTYYLFFKAQKIISHLDPYRHLPINMTYISLVAL